MDLFGIDIQNSFMEYIKTNDFLGGGLVIAIFTTVLYQVRALLGKFRLLLVRLFSTQITCTSEMSAEYGKLDYWIFNNFKNINSINLNEAHDSVGVCSTIQYKYFCPIYINKSLSNKENISYAIFEYYIRIYGPKFIRDKIIKEIRSLELTEVVPKIYNNDCYFDDIKYAQKPICKDSENILADYISFINNEKLYTDKNLKYHRNYLLYGPPGTGKTSIIRYIAKQTKKNIHSINIDKNTSNYSLLNYFNNNTKESIFVIEDFDRINLESEENSWNKQTLMNILDGVYTRNAGVIFITVNDISKIDPVILRSGRFDAFYEIKNPTDEEIDEYLKENDIIIDPEKLYGKTLSDIQKIIKESFAPSIIHTY